MIALSARSSAEHFTTPPRWWAPPVAGLVIILASVAVYHNSFQGPFIFDDIESIKNNPTIRSLWPIWSALSPPRGGGLAVQDRPIVNLSLAINYAIGGLDVRGYHIFNLAIHILAALTLFGIVRGTLKLPVIPQALAAGATPLALAVALIWAVHPLQTEAVTYVIQRTESMMGLFYLLTLYCAIRAAGASRPFWWYVATVTACALGMGCKEAMVTAPVVILVYDRLFLAPSFNVAFARRWRLYVPLAATWAPLAALVLPLSGRGIDHAAQGLEYWQATHSYALTQIVAVVRYLGLCFWPHPLIVDYGHLPAGEITLSIPHAIILVMLLAAAVVAFFYRPPLGFLGLWFVAILAPSSSIVPLVVQPIAEKRMYLPLAAVVVGVVLCAYVLGQHLANRLSTSRTAARILGCGLTAAVVLVLGFLTVRRNDDYRNKLAIWHDAVEKRPDNWRSWNNLGRAYASEGNHDHAIGDYDQAVKLNPLYAKAYTNRGNAYLAKGNYDRAVGDYDKAIDLNPKFAGPYNNRSIVHRKRGRYDDAIRDANRAIELNPRFAKAYRNRGIAYDRKGNHDQAISNFTQAITLNPKLPGPYNDRGIAHGNNGNHDRAIGDYDKAIALNPKFAKAFRNRGVAYDRKGEHDRAIRDLTRVIDLNSDRPEAYCDRGIARDHKGDYDHAIRDYSKAIALDPKFAKAYYNRAVMHFYKRSYKSAQADVNAAQALGWTVDPTFLELLRKASPDN
ncbi:MAG: tetratricopeptide repeat protein [Phycisphaerae bacterium]|nr:tetratricopeptide repeat protein [Phycisphaerae bacterium]